MMPTARREAVEAAGSKGCISPKANRKKPAAYDKALFAKRHVVEKF